MSTFTLGCAFLLSPRMNRAKVAGFELDVGMRTTHHFMYPESAVNLGPGVHLVLVPFKPLDLQWVASAFSTGALTQCVGFRGQHLLCWDSGDDMEWSWGSSCLSGALVPWSWWDVGPLGGVLASLYTTVWQRGH